MTLGPPPQRLAVDVEQVRALVADQFPQWAGLPIRPVAAGGWDNFTFHLGDEMSVRLPSAFEYALAVEKEHRWLPILAPQLPLPIPVPLGRGRPGAGYPFPWSIYRWLDGTPGSSVADPIALAEFVAALQRIDPAGGPPPGEHNWFRGGPLTTYDAEAERALTALTGRIDTDRVRALWTEARDTSWDGRVRWFHGDLAPGNLLHTGDRLSAVIDFGTSGVGDPACDLAIAWTLPDPVALRAHLTVDDATWTRARGWALWMSLAARARNAPSPALDHLLAG